jgi:hypothetical protein
MVTVLGGGGGGGGGLGLCVPPQALSASAPRGASSRQCFANRATIFPVLSSAAA